MISIATILDAAEARLEADATVMALSVVYQYQPAGEHSWTKRAVVLGDQSAVRDVPGSAYRSPSTDVLLRVMAFDRSDSAGSATMDRVFAVLERVNTVLTATPFTAGGTWHLEWNSAIPATLLTDQQGYPRPQAGNLYRLRVDG